MFDLITMKKLLLLIFCLTFAQASKVQDLCASNKTQDNEDLNQLCDLLNLSHAEGQGNFHPKPSQGRVWGYGFLCVTIISFMSVIGVSFLPLMSKSFYDYLLTLFIGLAVGSLSGSALFHLIPSAFRLADVTVNHSYLDVSLVIWSGTYLFFLIERFLKMFMEFQNSKSPPHNHKFTPVTEEIEYENSNHPCAGKYCRGCVIS